MNDRTKNVLITGTSSGIGLATAVGAAKSGWGVIATMRDVGKSQRLLEAAEVEGVANRIVVSQLDVTSEESVRLCLKDTLARFGRLDAVINNAGSGSLGTLEQGTVADVRKVFETNFFGVLNLTHAALPALRSSQGRLLNVTSVGGVVSQPFNEAYSAAKFAVEGFMEALAPVAATVGVSVSVVEPGAVASEFVKNIGLDESFIEAAGPYAAPLSKYVSRSLQAFEGAQTPEDAATSIIDLLNQENPAFRIQTSEAARNMVALKISDLDGSTVQQIMRSWLV
ncbi:SDR family oxidoreductase [Streptomyces sp. NPDC047028]|uniref:SDR family oxidoreductase n=1 Tax=Streptomyces sp. NPDC047028 TaxID=3155793 RepID=UPI0034119AE4